MKPLFNDRALPWRVKKMQALIEADDGEGMAAFLRKFPAAAAWEEVHGPNRQTWVHNAAKARKYKAAGALLEAGAEVNALGIGGATLMHAACRVHYADQTPMDAADEAFADKLLAHGADIDRGDNRNFNALVTACWSGRMDAVRFTLSRGADPDGPPDEYTGLLDVMASHAGWGGTIARTHEIVPLLLEAGADPNRVNASGMTPLFYVRDTKTAQMLMDAGADPECRNAAGLQAWECETMDSYVRAYIRQAAEARRQARQAAALEKDVEAACHDGVAAKPVKKIVLKNKL